MASREEEYQGSSAEDKVRSDPCAARSEVSAALRHFKRNGSFPEQKESNIQGWKYAYCAELSSGFRKRGAPAVPITELPLNKAISDFQSVKSLESC